MGVVVIIAETIDRQFQTVVNGVSGHKWHEVWEKQGDGIYNVVIGCKQRDHAIGLMEDFSRL